MNRRIAKTTRMFFMVCIFMVPVTTTLVFAALWVDTRQRYTDLQRTYAVLEQDVAFWRQQVQAQSGVPVPIEMRDMRHPWWK